MAKPRLGELLLGIHGLALLRLAFTDDATGRHARVQEMRALFQQIDGVEEMARPLPEPEYGLADGYRLWSETYDRPLRLFPIEEPPMHRILDSLPSSVVLDAACGTGRYSVHLAQRGHQVVGVDSSPEMLARARQKLPSVEFRQGDLADLPIESVSVDAAVCALALVHLPDIGKAVAELARVVRAGGRVLISDVHPFLILLGWQAQFQASAGDIGFMRLYAHLHSDYCAAYTAAGLRIRACYEPALTPEAAATVAAGRLPDASRAAFMGLPGVVVWDLEKPEP